jgi:hypothetical protein
VIVTAPARVPIALGVNVTVTVHVAPAARALPHVFVCVKSPLTATLETASGVDPLVMVTVCPELATPTACVPKLSPGTESVTPGTLEEGDEGVEDGVVGVELPHAMALATIVSTTAHNLKDRTQVSRNERRRRRPSRYIAAPAPSQHAGSN